MQFNLADNSRLIVLVLLGVAILLPWFLSQMRSNENLRWMEVEDLARKLETKNEFLVLDVRTREEFNGPLKHIKQAVNIPLHELTSRMNEVSSHKDKPVIVICRTDRRASSAAGMLIKAGLNDVTVVRGGMVRWSQLK